MRWPSGDSAAELAPASALVLVRCVRRSAAVLTLIWLGVSSLAHAGGVIGLEWQPFGRADLAYVDEDRLSGTGVAVGDGQLRPPLSAWGGWLGDRQGVVLELSAASDSTSIWTAGDDGDERTRLRVAGVRIGGDYRWYWKGRPEAAVGPYLHAGVHGVVPRVSYTSERWTEEETQAWAETAKSDRARIGAYGARLGLGADRRFAGGLSVGVRTAIDVTRGQLVDEDVVSVSSRWSSEAALTFGLEI